MGIFPFLVVVWIVVAGLYGIVTSRDLIHQIVCLIVVQSSTYVLLLGVGYVTGGAAPYFFDIPQRTKAVDPSSRRSRSPASWSRRRSPRCCCRSRSRRTSGSARSTRSS